MADPTTEENVLALGDLLEPQVWPLPTAVPLTLAAAAALSSAISLKRIADILASDQLPPCFQNVNAYGENFAVAIQEGIVRGNRGVSQYG
jgi:hypothetical protein